MIHSQGLEERSRHGLACFKQTQAQPSTGEENHDGMLRSGGTHGRRNKPQLWKDLRRARPLRREANHDGMLRSGGPRGDVTHPRCGWFCAGPDPLGERPITTACCDQGGRAET